MKITIINPDGKEKRYTRVELEEYIEQLRNGTYRHTYLRDFTKDIMKRLEKSFPTFTVRKNTDKDLGVKLTDMGYEYKRQNKGTSYRMKER